MRQAVLTVASLCLMAALCEQLLEGGAFFGVVRLAIGLELVWVVVSLAERVLTVLN